MESALAWDSKTLIDELTRGMENAMQLRLHLCSMFPSEAQELLVQRILSTFEKALLTLGWSESCGQGQVGVSTSIAPEFSISVDESPRSEDTNKLFRNRSNNGVASKKRKLQPAWTEQVRVNYENGLEGPTDDGYSWRKYGQKDILGAKYPRSYYRCSHRRARNCWATKQVQRSDDDPTVFEITYKGIHECNQSCNAVPPPTSPEKQEVKHKDSHYHQLEQQNEALLNFKANLRVNTEELDIKETVAHFSFPSTFAFQDRENHCSPISTLADDSHLGAYSPFYSPDASESNYFSAATYQTINYGGTPVRYSEINIADVISAHASNTNSPIEDMEFSIDLLDLDTAFPLTPRYFSHN